MTQKQILLTISLLGFALIVGFVLLFSPLTNNLFAANGNLMDDALGLLIGIVMLSCLTALGITSIVAFCYLGKRLGYDLYSGLLLLIPGVNLVVFFLWAFKESPNERKLQKYLAKPE